MVTGRRERSDLVKKCREDRNASQTLSSALTSHYANDSRDMAFSLLPIGATYGLLFRYHSTGSAARPPVRTFMRIRSSLTGTVSRIPGKRAGSWPKTACSSSRASGAPRQ